MRFLTVDHGGWLSNFGKAPKAMMVVLGNPLIAITMIKHDIRVGLNVPVRIYIYEGCGRSHARGLRLAIHAYERPRQRRCR